MINEKTQRQIMGQIPCEMLRENMGMDYKKLGAVLAWHRKQKNLRQTDVEILSDHTLKQSAISALEHGETRISVETFVEYCNAIGIRADTALDTFLTASPEQEASDAIVDPYVIALARLLGDCSSETKQSILEIAAILKQQAGELEAENRRLKVICRKAEEHDGY